MLDGRTTDDDGRTTEHAYTISSLMSLMAEVSLKNLNKSTCPKSSYLKKCDYLPLLFQGQNSFHCLSNFGVISIKEIISFKDDCTTYTVQLNSTKRG